MPIIGSPVSGVTTDADILDVAMALLGERLYSQMTAGDDAYDAATKLYALQRDVVLAEHPWNGCVAQVALVSTTKTPLFDWSYEYVYPADCLRILRLSDDWDRWEVGWNGTDNQKVVWCDVSPASMRYIFRNPNVQTYSPHLAKAIAANIAAELASALTAHMGKVDRLTEHYLQMLAVGKHKDGQEQSPTVLQSTTLTDDVRHGG